MVQVLFFMSEFVNVLLSFEYMNLLTLFLSMLDLRGSEVLKVDELQCP